MDAHEIVQHTGHHASRSPEFVEDELELVSGHSFLTYSYISSILMDETFENCSSLQLQLLLAHNNGGLTHSYQHIFNDFYDILTEKPSDVHLCSPLCVQPTSGSHTEFECGARCSNYQLQDDSKHHSNVQVCNDASTRNNRRMMLSGMVQADEHRAMLFGPTTLLGHQAALQEHYDHELQATNGSFVHTASTSDTCNKHVANRGCSDASSHAHQPSFDESRTVLGCSLPKTGTGDVSFVRNSDLAAELHAQLFDECRREVALPILRDIPCANLQVKGREDAALTGAVDLKALLLRSAKALGEGNARKAMELLQRVQQEGASPFGSGRQRVVHYFSEAMVARMSGMGSTLYGAIVNTSQLPSALMTLKAYKLVFEVCPYLTLAFYFANQYILKAASSASHLHIVDYGIFYGFQWPCLIYALAHRPGGPPFIRITGIKLPTKPVDINPADTTEGTGVRLAEYAKTYNVPFEYHAISSSSWEEIDPSSLHILPNEVLVLNSFNRLHHLYDESVIATSPRDLLLRHMRSLNPRLLVTGFMNASHSSPFFVPRFREALNYYYNKFDTIHTTVYSDSPERVMFEREVMGWAILNVVACEGMERVECPETYKQWQARIQRAGFRQLPLLSSVLSTAQTVMRSYHKDFSLHQDSNVWMLTGWRGRIMQALSAWEPAALP